MRNRRDKHRRFFVGQTGEYYVLFRLSEANLLATLAPPNSPHVDILVSDLRNHVLATIQVKTRDRGGDGGWCLKGNDARFVSDYHFFVFVDLEMRINGGPASYVVPSRVVSDLIERMQNGDRLVLDALQSSFFQTKTGPKDGKPKFDMYQLLPILRDPPPGLTKHWLVDMFHDAYFLLNMPLFKYKTRRPTLPSLSNSRENCDS